MYIFKWMLHLSKRQNAKKNPRLGKNSNMLIILHKPIILFIVEFKYLLCFCATKRCIFRLKNEQPMLKILTSYSYFID